MNEIKRPAKNQAERIEAILAEFDDKKELLLSLCHKTKNLLEELLEDAGVRYQSVQARVKSRKKIEKKYLNPKKAYTKLDDIKDLAGLRIITYYEDEVNLVAELIRKEFAIDFENTVDRRDPPIDRFGYHAINFICRYSAPRSASAEYRKFSESHFEIQVTSILRHAWAEIEHDWYDLRDAYPHNIKRRFYRMAALLEVAESEFLDLRKKRRDYERSIAVQVEANISGVTVNAVSLAAFIDQDSLVAKLDAQIAMMMGGKRAVGPSQAESILELLLKAQIKTIEEVRSELSKYQDAIIESLEKSAPHIKRLNHSSSTRGASIFWLGLLLMAKKDDIDVAKIKEELKIDMEFIDPEWLGKLLSSIARKVQDN